MKDVKIGDIVVIATVVFVSLALLVFSLLMRSGNTVLLVSYGDSEEYYDLNKDTEFIVENNGHTLIVEIKEGKASVISSTCDGQDCVNMGGIPSGSSTIACLPARVFMKIVSDSDKGEYDGVVG